MGRRQIQIILGKFYNIMEECINILNPERKGGMKTVKGGKEGSQKEAGTFLSLILGPLR